MDKNFEGPGYVECSKDNNTKSSQSRVTISLFCMLSHCALLKFHENIPELWSGYKL